MAGLVDYDGGGETGINWGQASVDCDKCHARLGEIRVHQRNGLATSTTLILEAGLVTLPEPHPEGWLRFGLPREGRTSEQVHTREPVVWVYCPRCHAGQLVDHRDTVTADRGTPD